VQNSAVVSTDSKSFFIIWPSIVVFMIATATYAVRSAFIVPASRY
jgi:hypothetical protein